MFNNNVDFYPTPKNLIDKMLHDIDFKKINSVLEPSAGKGDILQVKKISDDIGYCREYFKDIKNGKIYVKQEEIKGKKYSIKFE